MSGERLVYSIQRTYIIKSVSNLENRILTCDERIDIPTIEPLSQMKAVVYQEQPVTVVPCIELAGAFLSEFDLMFETNEGETVLPVKIQSGSDNPYLHFRYVLVLPRGATGVKSCKLIHKATSKEVQHNFTFGIMPPPYNYDNALFGYLSYGVQNNGESISGLYHAVLQAFGKLTQGLYEVQVQKSTFPMTSTPIPENRNLSMIKFKVKNRTGAKASLELELIYRLSNNLRGGATQALPIAPGDNSVVIDIDKGTITTISDRTAESFMVSFPAKYDNRVITALDKASITGDTTSSEIDYTYYIKPSLIPQG